MKPTNLEVQGANALEIRPSLTSDQEAQLALQSAMEVLTLAKAVTVATEQDYRAADDACAAIKAAIKKADAKRDELVRPLNTVVKKINAQFKDVENAFNQALVFYRQPMTAFQTRLAEERRRAEEAARLEQERQRKEAEEIARVAEEALKEARRQAQEAAKAAEAEVDPFEQALLQQEADDAARAQQEQLAAAQQAIRDVRAIEVVPDFTPKVTGAGSKTFTVWTYKITDPALVPMRFRPIDETLIAREVRELKDACSIPGVEISSHLEVK